MLEIRDLSKSYRKRSALCHVDLKFDHGIYAILGPNGSGKSTLMNLICDQLRADEGEILWKGRPIQDWKARYHAVLGYAPQQQGLYDDMSGRRFLTYMALLKKVPKAEIAKEVERVAALVNMQEELERKCKAYSGGMKQRILVAQALLGKPELLVFDEPSTGLDPRERVSLRHVFQRMKETHTILIATHVVSDIEPIAKEVILLKQGEVIMHGRIPDLLSRQAGADDLESLYLRLFGEDAA